MSAPATHIKVRCHYCSRWMVAGDIAEMGTGGIHICQACLEWHSKALEYLTKNIPPPGCQICGQSLAELAARSGSARPADNPLWLAPKDGIYQIVCTKCREAYEQKRADLYGETQYGHEMKIGR